jgi:hypothetical protein
MEDAVDTLKHYFRIYDPVAEGVDHLLMWLWNEGFKLVPLDGTEDADEIQGYKN